MTDSLPVLGQEEDVANFVTLQQQEGGKQIAINPEQVRTVEFHHAEWSRVVFAPDHDVLVAGSVLQVMGQLFNPH